jgi:protein-S-isoprenylcysteine O-methyltransferase Ste14
MNNNNIIKSVIMVGILILLFIVAVSLLKFAIRTLLPIAIIIIAAYIVYMVITGKK